MACSAGEDLADKAGDEGSSDGDEGVLAHMIRSGTTEKLMHTKPWSPRRLTGLHPLR